MNYTDSNSISDGDDSDTEPEVLKTPVKKSRGKKSNKSLLKVKVVNNKKKTNKGTSSSNNQPVASISSFEDQHEHSSDDDSMSDSDSDDQSSENESDIELQGQASSNAGPNKNEYGYTAQAWKKLTVQEKSAVKLAQQKKEWVNPGWTTDPAVGQPVVLGPRLLFDHNNSELDCFLDMFPVQFVKEHLLKSTNMRHNIDLTYHELMHFLGILLSMQIHRLPEYRMY